MNSPSPINHDPFAHLATREALAEVATRLDTVLPHLATKADLERVSNRLLFWLTGTLVTCLLAFYGLHSSLIAAQQGRLNELQAVAREQQQILQQMIAEQKRMSDQLERISRPPAEPSRRE